jgi:hypothetical protein
VSEVDDPVTEQARVQREIHRERRSCPDPRAARARIRWPGTDLDVAQLGKMNHQTYL